MVRRCADAPYENLLFIRHGERGLTEKSISLVTEVCNAPKVSQTGQDVPVSINRCFSSPSSASNAVPMINPAWM